MGGRERRPEFLDESDSNWLSWNHWNPSIPSPIGNSLSAVVIDPLSESQPESSITLSEPTSTGSNCLPLSTVNGAPSKNTLLTFSVPPFYTPYWILSQPLITVTKERMNTSKPLRLLVVTAHPADAFDNAAGTIAAHVERGGTWFESSTSNALRPPCGNCVATSKGGTMWKLCR